MMFTLSTVPVKVLPSTASAVMDTSWPTWSLLMSFSLTFISKVRVDISYSTAREPPAAVRLLESMVSPALNFFSMMVPEMGAVMV